MGGEGAGAAPGAADVADSDGFLDAVDPDASEPSFEPTNRDVTRVVGPSRQPRGNPELAQTRPSPPPQMPSGPQTRSDTTTESEALRLLTGGADGPLSDALGALPLTDAQRYSFEEPLGAGGMGHVWRVRDNWLGRDVAMKRPRERVRGRDEYVRALQREAQIIGQLEHPAIIPVHELGVVVPPANAGVPGPSASGHVATERPDGAVQGAAPGQPEAYYTMKLMGHTSLAEVLERLRLGEPAARERWPLRRLLQVVLQMAQGMEFAHARGVVHRDLKPDNVLLGEFGEVQIMDWGIAKRMHGADAPAGSPDAGAPRPYASTASSNASTASSDASTASSDAAARGRPAASADGDGPESPSNTGQFILGTPAYMSPEQAAGDDALVDGRSDVFSLGVVLYEVLALRRPFTRLGEVRRRPLAPSRVARDHDVPAELDELTLSMLAVDRDKRMAGMAEVRDALEKVLAGEKERSRRRDRAQSLYREALAGLERYDALTTAIERSTTELGARKATIRPWHDQQRRHGLVALGHRIERLVQRRTVVFGEVTEQLRQAVEAADHRDARRRLIKLYWQGHDDAERRGDAASQITWAALAHELEHASGRALDRSTLHVRTQPSGARVWAVPFGAGGRQDRPASLRDEDALGAAPLANVRLPPGPYTLVARADGHREVQESVYLRAGESHDALLICQPWSTEQPVVGRSVELARLLSWLDDAELRSRPVTCLVTGKAGMGTGQLVDALRARVASHPHRVFLLAEVACSPLRRDLPYAAVVGLVRMRAGIHSHDTADEARAKVERMVRQAFSRFGARQLDPVDDAEASRVAAAIASLPAFDSADPARQRLSEPVDADARAAFVRALGVYFRRAAVHYPVLMIVRDAHQADDASREVLEELLPELDGAPLVFVATARDEERARLPYWSGAGTSDLPRGARFLHVLELPPLAPRVVDHQLRELLGAPVGKALSAWLQDHAQGNPLILVELLAVLEARGALIRDLGVWRLDVGRAPLGVTAGDVDAALRAKLAVLSDRARHLLALAAVLGLRAWRGALLALRACDGDEAALDAELDALVQQRLLVVAASSRYPGEREFRPGTTALWRVAYDQLAVDARRRAHGRAAAWMLRQGRHDLEESLRLAYHLELGAQPAEAALLLIRTARAAEHVRGWHEAARLYTRAFVLSDAADLRRLAQDGLRRVTRHLSRDGAERVDPRRA